MLHENEKLREILEQLPESQQRLLEFAQEKGASNWFTALPLGEYDYFLHKGDSRDALSLQYGWHLNNLPTVCACGKPTSVEHALVCHKGGHTITHHNALCELTVTPLREVCPDTSTEPPLVCTTQW